MERWSIGVIAGMDSRRTTLRYPLARLLLIACFPMVCLDTSPAAQTKIWEELSGEKALAHVQRLVDFGPRPSGSEAIEKSRRYIEDQLRRSGWQVTRQAFTDDTPRGKVQFVNLIAQFSGQGNAAPLFLLCSHYDTKTFDAIKFLGANDGGSSTGLLLELARVIGQHPNSGCEESSLCFLTAKKRTIIFRRRMACTEAAILPSTSKATGNSAAGSCSTWLAIVRSTLHFLQIRLPKWREIFLRQAKRSSCEVISRTLTGR